MRIILLDIGNTSVTQAVYEGGRFHSFRSYIHNDIPKNVKKILSSGGEHVIHNIVISSVVPKVTQIIKRNLKRREAVKIWVVNQNLPLIINHKYRSYKKLGSDRAVNIYGAVRIHKPPLLVIDFGTAITADYISKKGVFEGGMIIPGPEIAFQALLSRAALIPKKARLPEKARSFLGITTYDCMSSGILQGYGAMVDALVERFRRRFGHRLRVLATGGFVAHLRPYTHAFDIVDPRHSIKSLLLLFKAHSSAGGRI